MPRWGAPEGVRVGDDVVAVARGDTGRAWVSSGVVSVVNQLVADPNGTSYAGLIGTDTSANADEAGGALLDGDGAVIGILTASPDAMAVPIDIARGVADQLGSSGKAAHGWLGVWGAAVLDRAGGGVRVEQVAGYSPALKAGIVPGDIITAVGDDAVADLGDLVAAVRRRAPPRPGRHHDGPQRQAHASSTSSSPTATSSPPPARPAVDPTTVTALVLGTQNPDDSGSACQERGGRATMECDDERNPD